MAFEMNEKSWAEYTVTLRDEHDQVIPASILTALTLTLYDMTTGTIINSRDNQNVLNANNVTIGEDGVLAWQVQTADSIIVDSTRIGEAHEALWEYQFAGKVGRHRTRIYVRNLSKIS